jgi:hypothetical protein
VSDKLSAALPVYCLLVMGLALLLLIIVFRAVAVPVKAALGFLLSVGASLGAMVAVFQWGWLSGLLGIEDQELTADPPGADLAALRLHTPYGPRSNRAGPLILELTLDYGTEYAAIGRRGRKDLLREVCHSSLTLRQRGSRVRSRSRCLAP